MIHLSLQLPTLYYLLMQRVTSAVKRHQEPHGMSVAVLYVLCPREMSSSKTITLLTTREEKQILVGRLVEQTKQRVWR